MHEASIVASIIHIAQEEITRCDLKGKVEEIELEIGALVGVEIGVFEFAWQSAVKNTILERAEKITHQIPGMAYCAHCQESFSIAQYYDPCPYCGNFDKEIQQGQQLRIKSMTIQ